MTAIYAFLAIFAYLQIGHRLGPVSFRAWTDPGASKILKFLMFPLHFYRGKVGSEDAEIEALDKHDIFLTIPPAWRQPSLRTQCRTNYCLRVTIHWPAKLIGNMFIILFWPIGRVLEIGSDILPIAGRAIAAGVSFIFMVMTVGPDLLLARAVTSLRLGLERRRARLAASADMPSTPTAACSRRDVDASP